LFSISAFLEKKEELSSKNNEKEENLPSDPFSEKQLLEEWNLFLQNLQTKNSHEYSAIKNCKLHKNSDNEIIVKVASEAMKEELRALETIFLSNFTNKVNNFHIKFKYEENQTLQREIITKRKLFDRFVEENPILKDLEDLMKFDFS